MAASVRSVGTVSKGSGNVTASPGLPSGVQENDILIVFMGIRGSLWQSPPSPWTWIDAFYGLNNGGSVIEAYWKRAGPSESAPTFNMGGSQNDWCIQVVAIQGCPTDGDPFDVAESASNANPQSVTTTVDNDLVLGALSSAYATTAGAEYTWTNANLTGVTELIDDVKFTGGSGATLGVAAGVKATAGATGAWTVSRSGANYTTASVTITLKPGAAPPTTVTLVGAMTATARAPIPVVQFSVTITAPKMSATTKFWVPTPGIVPNITILAPVATGSSLMTLPEVILRVEAGVAIAYTQFPSPPLLFTPIIEPEPFTTTANFPAPNVSVDPDYPYAKTAQASAVALTPRRFGGPTPSIYKEMVARVAPEYLANFSLDEHTGDPIIVGDPLGKSEVFDGIDDVHALSVPSHLNHTMVLWFVADEGEPPTAWPGLIWRPASETDPNIRFTLMVYNSSAPVDAEYDGRLRMANPSGGRIDGPFVRDGLRHMLMLTWRQRGEPNAGETKLFLDGEDLGVPIDFVSPVTMAWTGGIIGDKLKGRIDEVTFWDTYLQPEWATELWWQGIGEGGPPTTIQVVNTPTTSTRMPAPAVAIRPVLDAWQVHDDFLEDLDPELWVVGYQPQFLQSEGPGGPAPPVPMNESPFVLDGEMTIRAGTQISTRDWLSFGEWIARIEMDPIDGDSDVVVAIGLMAAFPQDGDWCGFFPFTPGCPVKGMPYTEEYENQFAWWTYISGSRRYVSRAWGVYSPDWDDAAAIEIVPYNPADHGVVIVSSPHSRGGQNVTGYDSGDSQPGGGLGDGHMPYWPMEEQNPYESRALKLVIQVSGPPGESIVITGINLTPPATKIAIPTGHLTGDVGAIVGQTHPQPYEGPKLARSIKPPPIRTTGRFLRPPSQAAINAELMSSIADFRWPEWAGDARPSTQFPGSSSAFAKAIPPILFGVPVDVVIDDVPTAKGSGRMLLVGTSGVQRPAYGITEFKIKKMPITIKVTEIEMGVGVRELVSA